MHACTGCHQDFCPASPSQCTPVTYPEQAHSVPALHQNCTANIFLFTGAHRHHPHVCCGWKRSHNQCQYSVITRIYLRGTGSSLCHWILQVILIVSSMQFPLFAVSRRGWVGRIMGTTLRGSVHSRLVNTRPFTKDSSSASLKASLAKAGREGRILQQRSETAPPESKQDPKSRHT